MCTKIPINCDYDQSDVLWIGWSQSIPINIVWIKLSVCPYGCVCVFISNVYILSVLQSCFRIYLIPFRFIRAADWVFMRRQIPLTLCYIISNEFCVLVFRIFGDWNLCKNSRRKKRKKNGAQFSCDFRQKIGRKWDENHAEPQIKSTI